MFQQGKQAFVLSNNTACMPPSSPLMNSISDDFAPHEPNRQLKQPHKISKNLDKVWHAPGRIPNKFPEMHVTLKYFPIRGRAEPVRLICADANIDLIDESVGGRWAEEKTKTDVYLFGQCPAAVIDGVSIAQGDAILRALARKLGYYGKTDQEANNIDMMAAAVEDIKVPYLNLMYRAPPDIYAQELSKFSTIVENWIVHIAKFHESHGKKEFIAGENISFADFLVYEQLITLEYLFPKLLDTYLDLKAYLEKIQTRPNVKAYLLSGKRPVKVNNSGLGAMPVAA